MLYSASWLSCSIDSSAVWLQPWCCCRGIVNSVGLSCRPCHVDCALSQTWVLVSNGNAVKPVSSTMNCQWCQYWTNAPKLEDTADDFSLRLLKREWNSIALDRIQNLQLHLLRANFTYNCRRIPEWQHPFLRAFQKLLRETTIGQLFFSAIAKPQVRFVALACQLLASDVGTGPKVEGRFHVWLLAQSHKRGYKSIHLPKFANFPSTKIWLLEETLSHQLRLKHKFAQQLPIPDHPDHQFEWFLAWWCSCNAMLLQNWGVKTHVCGEVPNSSLSPRRVHQICASQQGSKADALLTRISASRIAFMSLSQALNFPRCSLLSYIWGLARDLMCSGRRPGCLLVCCL